MISAEWSDRTAFAEAAEVLGLNTDDILATTTLEDGLIVLYSKNYEDESSPCFSVRLQRDKQNILRVFGEPVELPGLFGMLRSITEIGSADSPSS